MSYKVKHYDKKTVTTQVYESVSYWNKRKK